MNGPNFLPLLSGVVAATISWGACRGLSAEAPGPTLRITAAPGAASPTISVAGRAPYYVRIDVSSTLGSWRPFALLLNATGTLDVTDPEGFLNPMRFYRAVEVEPGVGVTGLNSALAGPGARLEIYGQFFAAAAPGDNVVLIGDRAVPVLEASSTRLIIDLPPDVSSGELRVTSPFGSTFGLGTLVVTNQVTVAFMPPAGVTGTDYEVVNTYGRAAMAGDGSLQLTVRRGMPLLSMAVPRNAEQKTFFLAVSLDDSAPLVLDAASTARGLVFLHPALASADPANARAVLARIATNAEVAVLAVVIATVFPRGGDPFEDDQFVTALGDAIRSVAAIPPPGQVFRQSVDAGEGNVQTSTGDLDMLELIQDGPSVKIRSRSGNSLDWVVSVRRVDTKESFKNGRQDYDLARAEDHGLKTYQVVPGDERRLVVSAAAAREWVLENLRQEVHDPGLRWPDRSGEPATLDLHSDALYVVRGIGPAFHPPAENEFVEAHFRADHNRAFAINAVAVAGDLIVVAAELAGVGEAESFRKSFVSAAFGAASEMAPEAWKFDSKEKFFDAMSRIAKTGLGQLAWEGGLTGFFSAVGRIIGKTGEKVTVWGAIGGGLSDGADAATRAWAFLVSSTALETAFIEVGDAFRLDVISVLPPTGSIGDKVEIVLSGQYFDDTGRDGGFVEFCGGGARVERPGIAFLNQPDGTQKITVRVPHAILDLPPSVQANRTLIVAVKGRRGAGQFEFVPRPTVTHMEPSEGFAAVPDFDRAPFPGTAVRIQGFGFEPSDVFLFGGVPSLIKFGDHGDVTVNVPAGAKSGPIMVVRDVGTPQETNGLSPEFTVLSPPEIISHEPVAGPVGTSVQVRAINLGPGPAILELNGVWVGGKRFRGDTADGEVPFGAVSGPIRLITPAGAAEFTFTVLPGLSAGGIMRVGGDSLLSFSHALLIAAAPVSPTARIGCPPTDGNCVADDDDVERDKDGNFIRWLDPPDGLLEEGEFLTDNGALETPRYPFGASFADWIVITNTISGDFLVSSNSSFEVITGEWDLLSVISGKLTVAGRKNMIINLSVRGQLVVAGNDNEVNVTVSGSLGDGVLITGHHNRVTVNSVSNYNNGLVIDGGKGNQVFVHADDNGGSGLVLKGGARDNHISVSTGDGTPGSGNRTHGVALLGNATNNVIVAHAPVSGNDGDGVYVSGPGVRDNEILINHVVGNGGNGFSIRDHAVGTLVPITLAAGNGGDGIAILTGAVGTVVQNCFVVENSGYGVRISGIDDTNTSVNFAAQRNLKAGLRLEGGTRGVVCAGSSTGDAVGLELAGAATSKNTVTNRIIGAKGDGAIIQAASQNKLRLTVTGSAKSGVVLTAGASENDMRDLRSNDNGLHGLVIQDAGTKGNLIPNASIGVPVGTETAGNRGDGIRIEKGATANQIGNAAGEGAEVHDNSVAGIRLSGAGTTGNAIVNTVISETPLGRIQTAGIIIDGAPGNILGNNTISDHPSEGLWIDNAAGVILVPVPPGVRANHIMRNQIGIHLSGAATVQCRIGGHLLDQNVIGIQVNGGANNNEIGSGNTIRNGTTGILVDNASETRIEKNAVQNNAGAGIRFQGGAAKNLVLDNSITRNATGVEVVGAATIQNQITLNSITRNTGKGIRLVAGGNRELPAPVIGSLGSQRVTGFADVEENSTIELFSDPADEGFSYINSAHLFRGSFEVRVDGQPGFTPGLVGKAFNLHATATDTDRNTSEFGGTEASGETSVVAFTSTRDGNREIYLTDGFGAAATRLTTHSADDFRPALSPDRQHIAFVSLRDGNAEIYLLNVADTNEITRLTAQPSTEDEPAWSLDGSELAFVSNRDGNAEIYVMKKDGTDVRRLTFDSAEDRSPSWSADGAKIAFSSTRSGHSEIWVMNADGTSPTRLTTDASADTEPAWSPDGEWIAFVSQRDGNQEIYAMRPDGTELTRLTDHPAIDASPTWFPDSQTLAITSNRDEGFELYLLKRTGGALDRITVSGGDNFEPSAGR